MMLRRGALLTVCSAVFWWSLVDAQRNETASVCSDEEFFCQDPQRKCIPLEWVCDNVKDCSNGKVPAYFCRLDAR
jgi:hypothetical protein